MEIDSEIKAVAEGLYSKDLAYHNFNHVLDVISNAKKILDDCKKDCVIVDEAVVYYAILFHDAGYIENHFEKGFESKEEYAAFLAEETLRNFKFSDELIGRIKTAIVGTKDAGDFLTNEAKVVRAADLAGLAGDYKIFKENAKKLRKEWKMNTIKLIEFYLDQDIRLTKAHDVNGESAFHKKVKENLKRFLNDPDFA